MVFKYLITLIQIIENIFTHSWHDTYEDIQIGINSIIDTALENENKMQRKRKIQGRNKIVSHARRRRMMICTEVGMTKNSQGTRTTCNI